MLYSKTTRNVEVSVKPLYLDEQSNPDSNHYVWAYHVKIHNSGTETVQLRARYWKIIDSLGYAQEVEGDGVVGEQPVLKPGETFEYTSGTPLSTPGGIMTGLYKMIDGDGRAFDVEIPAFSLDSPYQSQVIH